MRVLLIHNRYREPGGEDQVFEAEGNLLAEHGHQVERWVRDNREIGAVGWAVMGVGALWNAGEASRLRRRLRELRPDVAHFHNTFPLISPAAYWAAAAEGVPVVQTLHNYRLLCVNGLLLRGGGPCEDCVGRRVALPGVVHACYRGSRAASAVVAAMQALHRALGTWRRKVDVYVALTEFVRAKMIEGGIPPERLAVKPNFLLEDPGPGSGGGGFALFVGRLSVEKGLDTLLEAWRRAPPGIDLRIVGDGPLAGEVGASSSGIPSVEWLGRQSRERVLELMREADLLVMPSRWYEGQPMVLAEAFACGLPVVATGNPSLASQVAEGRTGRLFRPGDPDHLATVVRQLAAGPEALAAMRAEARREFEAVYTAEKSYAALREIYRRAGAGSPRPRAG